MSELPALGLYGEALGTGRRLRLHHEDGHVAEFDVVRWTRRADATDRRLLQRCTGATLDLGCGPGRLVVALAERAIPALGVDICLRAVQLARQRGAAAIARDLFAPLPGEGRWPTAILADGNIGIGGNPARLLRRVHEVVCPGGLALVEASALDIERCGRARLVAVDGRRSTAFAWAEIGLPALLRVGRSTGWDVEGSWEDAGRRFAAFRRLEAAPPGSA